MRAFALVGALLACSPAIPLPQKPIDPPTEASTDLADPSAKWARFVSTRFGVSMPLPDGKSWKIDDHSRAVLTATHDTTRSSITLRTWTDDELQSRQRCEVRARLDRIFPDAELETVADDHVAEPPSYDTRLWIAIEPRAGAVIGHVIAIGGFVRRCIFFHFQTEVASGQEQLLSTRLALVRARVWQDIELGSINSIPKERPNLPGP